MIDAMMKNTVAPLVLRLCLAAVFIYHGMDLVSKSWGTAWSDQMPVIQQVLVAWGQLLGGIAMLLGLLTRLAAIGLGLIMVGAIAIVHWPNGFSLVKDGSYNGGYEYNVVLIAICIVLTLTGGGTLAADRWVRLRPKRH
jgi:putative oxidoreductase